MLISKLTGGNKTGIWIIWTNRQLWVRYEKKKKQ